MPQQLTVLNAVQTVAPVELDVFDLVRCAHWVCTGDELPIGQPPKDGD